MDKLNGQLLFLGNALHVHQTRRVGTRHIFGSRGDMALHLIDAHAAADGLLLDGKHTAEAATLVGALRLHHLDAIRSRSMILLKRGTLRSDGDDSPNSRTPWQELCTLTL